MLVDGVLADLDASGISRTRLSTVEAQALYERFGFVEITAPETIMGRYTDGFTGGA